MNIDEFVTYRKQNPHQEVFWVAAFALNHNDPIRKLERNVVPVKCAIGQNLRTLYKFGKNGQPTTSSVQLRGSEIFVTKEEAVEYYVNKVEYGQRVIRDRLQGKMNELNELVEKAHILRNSN